MSATECVAAGCPFPRPLPFSVIAPSAMNSADDVDVVQVEDEIEVGDWEVIEVDVSGFAAAFGREL